MSRRAPLIAFIPAALEIDSSISRDSGTPAPLAPSRSTDGHRSKTCAVSVGIIRLLGGASARAQENAAFFDAHPAFAPADGTPKEVATCATLSAQLPDTVDEVRRIDLHARGPVTLMQSDSALWYVAICSSPGARVPCVTSRANELKLGDEATLRGAYRREDVRHVRLDPCLAQKTK